MPSISPPRHVRIAALARSDLAAAERVLADACVFDRAREVAEEKLFGAAPVALPLGAGVGAAATATTAPAGVATQGLLSVAAFGAWEGDDLVGVAAVSGRWLRLVAVAPLARGHGAGSALVAACEARARATGESRLRVVDQPGNYLAPGVDARNTETIAWLERRGFARAGEPRCNLLIDVRDNPRVTAGRAETLAAAATARGYEVRRAHAGEHALTDAIAREFGGAWPFEVERALGHTPAGVHVATRDGAYCAFAAHDGNNRGLGWFGPTGTWAAHRGQGLGEALLVACLVDVAAAHARCEIAWIGPRPFYDKVAGIAGERAFIALGKPL